MLQKYKTHATQCSSAFKKVMHDSMYILLAISFALNLVALDYILLSQVTTFRIMALQNTLFYNLSVIVLSITTAALFGIASAMMVYIFKHRKENAKESAPTTLFGTLFAAIASGCPVCGAWLLPLLGIAGSLAAFPLQGLDIRILAIGLLIFSIVQSSEIILGICDKAATRRRNRNSIIVVTLFIVAILVLPNLPSQWRISFQKTGIARASQAQTAVDTNALYDQVNPTKGFEIPVTYGNIGYKLVQAGVIDYKKFSALYDQAGMPLTKEQKKVFSRQGLDAPIQITRENSYFLLNLFWAYGLANNNPILTKGQITQYGNSRIGDFASTGGWTIATKPLAAYYAKLTLAPLTAKQQALLQRVAESVYRPCCGNSTAFPDCNHGMALLGVLEMMTANGATEQQLYDAAKYFSAFWFPRQAMDIATYFKATKNQDFADIDGKVFVSEQYFSGRGWSVTRGWLDKNIKSGNTAAPSGGSSCGVESDTAAPVNTTPAAAPVAPQGGGGCGV